MYFVHFPGRFSNQTPTTSPTGKELLFYYSAYDHRLFDLESNGFLETWTGYLFVFLLVDFVYYLQGHDKTLRRRKVTIVLT